jgi:7,8-dihydropterin-6-yl-methyl-4-(beta-D-ribofuranosyl)aminobenzene 5'-phosphate synthase
MTVRITILCDNAVGPVSGTLGEHGFAALIEPDNGPPLLFDTGQGFTLLPNARRLNRDLSRVRHVVISHGHFDHAGGLLPLLQETGAKRVMGHPAIFTPRLRVKDTGECYPIGIPQTEAELTAAGAEFDLSRDFRHVAPGIYLSGEVPRLTSFETGDQGIFAHGSGREPDPTLDDQSLVVETARGLVIILGCCHAGLINTLEQVGKLTGRSDFYAIIGGTHLGFCSPEQINKTIATLRRMGVKKVAAGHCTGFAAMARLAREMAKEFQPAMVGYTLEI